MDLVFNNFHRDPKIRFEPKLIPGSFHSSPGVESAVLGSTLVGRNTEMASESNRIHIEFCLPALAVGQNNSQR
jgi:hypothetical protein